MQLCKWIFTGRISKNVGKPIFRCAQCNRAVSTTEPRDAICPKRGRGDQLHLVESCKLLGEQLGEVGCGCGARNKKVPVFQCGAGLGPCIERSANKAGLRFNGEKVVVCLGCSKREA
jgi:hypothetical protein